MFPSIHVEETFAAVSTFFASRCGRKFGYRFFLHEFCSCKKQTLAVNANMLELIDVNDWGQGKRADNQRSTEMFITIQVVIHQNHV